MKTIITKYSGAYKTTKPLGKKFMYKMEYGRHGGILQNIYADYQDAFEVFYWLNDNEFTKFNYEIIVNRTRHAYDIWLSVYREDDSQDVGAVLLERHHLKTFELIEYNTSPADDLCDLIGIPKIGDYCEYDARRDELTINGVRTVSTRICDFDLNEFESIDTDEYFWDMLESAVFYYDFNEFVEHLKSLNDEWADVLDRHILYTHNWKKWTFHAIRDIDLNNMACEHRLFTMNVRRDIEIMNEILSHIRNFAYEAYYSTFKFIQEEEACEII